MARVGSEVDGYDPRTGEVEGLSAFGFPNCTTESGERKPEAESLLLGIGLTKK